MASKLYTAQDMREMADKLESRKAYAICYFDATDNEWRPVWQNPDSAVLALRQAADAMESEKKREKKYEYTQKYISVDGKKDAISRIHYETIDQADVTAVRAHGVQHITLRRPVGEWEEVSNG